MKRKEETTQFLDSTISSKCIGRGNGRRSSTITAKVRKQLNKIRRRHLNKDTEERINDA